MPAVIPYILDTGAIGLLERATPLGMDGKLSSSWWMLWLGLSANRGEDRAIRVEKDSEIWTHLLALKEETKGPFVLLTSGYPLAQTLVQNQ
jgi:hypothetical protein